MNLIRIPHSKEVVTNIQLSTEYLLVRTDGVRNALLPLVKNPRDRGAWWATVHAVRESDMTELFTLTTYSSASEMTDIQLSRLTRKKIIYE